MNIIAAILQFYGVYLARPLQRIWPNHFAELGTVFTLPCFAIKQMTLAVAPDEAEALRYVRRHTTIPVPKVYASVNGFGYNFILMERIEGICLPAVWHKLTEQQRDGIIAQLQGYIAQLRSLPSPYGKRVCSAKGGSLWDVRITSSKRIGPFEDEADFNDALIEWAEVFIHPQTLSTIRPRMRDDHRIFFTHGDMAPRNIIIKDGRVNGLVDWGNSGWLPEYWELVKVMWCPALDEDWDRRIQAIFSDEDIKDWMIDREMSDECVGAF